MLRLRKIPKGRRSHLHRGGNLLSRKKANECFKQKKIDFLLSTNFKLLSQRKGNSVHEGLFF